MESPQTKRTKAVADNTLHEKVQKLPLLCIEAICKFTPTCELLRLHSAAVALPGPLWSLSVEASLKKRSPLCLSVDTAHYQADHAQNDIFILDATRAIIAGVKQPQAFRFSTLGEFIESAALTTRIFRMGASYDSNEFQIVHGQALLPHLPNLSELTLVVRDSLVSWRSVPTGPYDILDPCMRSCLHALRSFAVAVAYHLMNTATLHVMARLMRKLPIQEMSSLHSLDLPVAAWGGVMERAASDIAAWNVLAGLRALHCWQGAVLPQVYAGSGELTLTPDCGQILHQALNFASTQGTLLSTLSLMVDGDFEPYVTAFRALSGLVTLGLYLVQTELKRPLVKCETISTVLDLRLMWMPSTKHETGMWLVGASGYGPVEKSIKYGIFLLFKGSTLFAIASLFPNAKYFALQHNEDGINPLSLASEFCTRQVLPNVERLRCHQFDENSTCSHQWLMRFLDNPNLPDAVDLSQIVLRGAELVRVFGIMETNSPRLLLIRGPLQRGALSQVDRHVSLNGGDVEWTSASGRYLGDGFELKQLTDHTIVGTKTSGRLQDDEFTIRIVSHVSKRSRLFD